MSHNLYSYRFFAPLNVLGYCKFKHLQQSYLRKYSERHWCFKSNQELNFHLMNGLCTRTFLLVDISDLHLVIFCVGSGPLQLDFVLAFIHFSTDPNLLV